MNRKSRRNKRFMSMAASAAAVALVVSPLANVGLGDLSPFATKEVHASGFAGGSGTVADPYLISTVEQFNQMRENLKAHYKLVNDLDFSIYNALGMQWTPIGTTTTNFTGSLDGNGFTVKNVPIKSNTANSGLFGVTSYATIKNLILENITVDGGSGNYIGILIGQTNGGTFKNIQIINGVAKSTGNIVGGLLGGGNSTATITISDVIVDAKVSGRGIIGGLIGSATSGTNLTNVITYGEVNATGKYIGGVIGSATMGYSNKYNNIFSYNAVRSTTTESNPEIGGIVGAVTSTSKTPETLNNLYAFNSEIKGSSPDSTIAALIGSTSTSYVYSRVLNNCYALDNIQGNAHYRYVKKVLTTEQIQDVNFYKLNQLNFDNQWTMDITPTLINNAFTQRGLQTTQLAPSIFTNKPIFAGGSGTIDDPFLISTVEQLKNIDRDLYSSYKLINDIDLSGIQWKPLGGNSDSKQYPYRGAFDGNGYSIKNLYINENNDVNRTIGFFTNIASDGSSKSGSVRNLTFENPHLKVTNSKYYQTDSFGTTSASGILTGRISSRGSFENIKIVNPKLQYTSRDQYFPHNMGGLAGAVISDDISIKDVSIKNIDAKQIDSQYPYSVGGLVGVQTWGNDISYNNIIITGKLNGSAVGGMMAVNYGFATIQNLDVDVDIISSGSAGGLTSIHDSTGDTVSAYLTVKNAVIKGTINSKVNTGGLVGLIRDNGNVELQNVFIKNHLSGTDNVGGVVGGFNSPGGRQYVTPNRVIKKMTNVYAYNPSVIGTGTKVGRIFGPTGTDTTQFSNIYGLDPSNTNAHSSWLTNSVTPDVSKMKMLYTLHGLDFENDWGIYEGESQPFLLFSLAEQEREQYEESEPSREQVERELKYNEALAAVVKAEGTFNAGNLVQAQTDKNAAQVLVNALSADESRKQELQVRLDALQTQITNANNAQAEKESKYNTALAAVLKAERFYNDGNYEQAQTDKNTAQALVNALGTDESRKQGLQDRLDTLQRNLTERVDQVLTSAPQNLSVVANSPKQVTVSFDAVPTATDYVIKRNGVIVAYVNEPTFVDTNVSHSQTYTYEVSARNALSTSPAVTGQVQTPVQYHDVTLTWPAIQDIEKYVIKRNGVVIGETVETTFVDREAVEGATYQYEVVAVNEAYGIALSNMLEPFQIGQEPVSVEFNEFPEEEEEVEEVQKVENIVAVKERDKISITWNALDGATRYRVQRYVKNEDGVFVTDGFGRAVSGTTHQDTNFVIGKEYYFEIVPQIGGKYDREFSGISNNVTIDTPPASEVETPTIKNIQAEYVEGKVRLTWDAFETNSASATRYRVQAYELDRVTNDYVAVGTTLTAGINEFTYTRQLTEGKQYRFEIIPLVNGQYHDAYKNTSNSIEAPTTPVEEPKVEEPETPLNVTAIVQGDNVLLSWSEVMNALSYKVEVFKETANGTFESVGYPLSNLTNTRLITNLEANTTYQFKITPRVNFVFNPLLAMTETVTTAATAPTENHVGIENLRVEMNGSKATLTWDALTVDGKEATRYRIQRYVYNEATSQYDKNGVKLTATSTSQVINFTHKTDVKYRYEVTPMINNKYEDKYQTTTDDVNGLSNGQVQTFE